MDANHLSAGAAARRLGVAVTTLRTWHQRYGLGPSAHRPGEHRRYTVDDLARLDAMRRLTADGVPPAQAARWVREQPGVYRRRLPGERPGVTTPGDGGTPPDVATSADDSNDTRISYDTGTNDEPGDRHGAGGRGGIRRDGAGLPVGSAGPAARGFAHAAMRLDSLAIRDLSMRLIAGFGVVAAWERVFAPVLVAIGDRHAETGELIEVEHVVSQALSDALATVDRPPAGTPVSILLACVDEEQHSLPLEAVAAALAEQGVASSLLGARVPPAALRAAIRRTGPTAVLLWSHRPETADPDQIRRILDERPRPLVLGAAGPGWLTGDLPPGVAVPASLTGAVDLLSPIGANHRPG